VLARVLATDTIPAPFPENFETASSACHCSVYCYRGVSLLDRNRDKHKKTIKASSGNHVRCNREYWRTLRRFSL
jgi:hypothetical protein